MNDERVLDQRAETIADLIQQTDTDSRGDLFAMVGKKLRQQHMQGFTASTLDVAAVRHGLNKHRW